MIRFILVCIVVIAYLVLTIPVLLVEWIIGKFSPMTKDIISLRMVQAIFKFILWITGAKVTVIGEENVPKDQAVLYVANHRSYFDILLTYSRCPMQFCILTPLYEEFSIVAIRLCCKERNGTLPAAFQLDA